jgi:hypothetical protein
MSAISAVIDTKPKAVRRKKVAVASDANPVSAPSNDMSQTLINSTSEPSPAVASPALDVAADVKTKEKKPTLPAKFGKFMQFGYFFVASMKDAGILDDTISAELFNRLCVFASVDDQKAYYETWLASAKDSNKVLRKAIALQRKASAPPKQRKPRLNKDNDNDNDPNAPPKLRKPRNNYKKNLDNDLINELSLLQSSS